MNAAHADAYEEDFAFSDAQAATGGPVLYYNRQNTAGTLSIDADSVDISVMAPVNSATGSAASNVYGYEMFNASGSGAAVSISGRDGVVLSSISNPVLTTSSSANYWQTDTKEKKSVILDARNRSQISVDASDGDISLNLADEIPSDTRDGSFNLVKDFSDSYNRSKLIAVRAYGGASVSLSGKNVSISIAGKEMPDGSQYYDPLVRFQNVQGIVATSRNSEVNVTATDGNNSITLENTGYYSNRVEALTNCVYANDGSSVNLKALKGDNVLTIQPGQDTDGGRDDITIMESWGGDMNLEGINNILTLVGTKNISGGKGIHVNRSGDVHMKATQDNRISFYTPNGGANWGITTGATNGVVDVYAEKGNNIISLTSDSLTASFMGIYNDGESAVVSLTAPQGDNRILAVADEAAQNRLMEAEGVQRPNGIYYRGLQILASNGTINMDGQNNDIEVLPVRNRGDFQVYGIHFGFSFKDHMAANLTAVHDNTIYSSGTGINMEAAKSHVNMEAQQGDNKIYGGEYGIYIPNYDDVLMHAEKGSNSVTSNGTGIYSVYNSAVTMQADEKDNTVTGEENGILTDRNGSVTLDSPKGTNTVTGGESAILAQKGGNVTVNSAEGTNTIAAETTAVNMKDGGTGIVTVDGQSQISAETALLIDGTSGDSYESYRGGSINVNYSGDSSITGDISALNEGNISVTPNDQGKMTLTGNIYAADESISLENYENLSAFDAGWYSLTVGDAWQNLATAGGTVDVHLTSGSVLTGTADTGKRYAKTLAAKRISTYDEMFEKSFQKYRDAQYEYFMASYGGQPTEEALEQFNQYMENAKNSLLHTFDEDTYTSQFTADGEKYGTVNITLDDGALWDMTGSSSVTTLGGSGGTVYYENGGDALEIGTLSGSHTFAMDLDADDGSNSDMLYINNGTSDEQTLVVKNLQTLDSQMDDGEAVRFATVSNSQDEFRNGKTVGYSTYGIYRDAFTVEYRDVATDPLNTDAYNKEYNGDTTDGIRKPTTDYVNTYYIDGYDDPQNVYLVKSTEALNDGAVTPERNRDLIWRYVTDMDTFTKRDGQSQYFTDDGKRGGWVRLGYRNLGVDGVGELDGNTYELGWTTISRQNDERKHRFSASVAYGKPKGQFEGYGGNLTVRDFSVNLYDTHEYYPSAEELANKPEWKKESHAYWDNYLKYHHVKTEYDAYDHVVGTKYSGDYDQNVWNLSTEYGHKLMMNEDWFWVPQAQLQLSYLGGYDYVDSQGLHVDGDHDWSLIGRLGFDLVRDIHDSRDSKLYFKASLMHEFLDGNDVTVRYDGDRYVNEGDQSGTWGVVGLGYSSKIGKEQYFYIDAERYFGNDFERTYDIRAGINWKF
jgi:outer membrane autotransporter protein